MSQSKQMHDESSSMQVLPDKATESPALLKNKSVICKTLLEAGVESVTLTYSGWSDHGEITSIAVEPTSAALPTNLVEIDIQFNRYDEKAGLWVGRHVPGQRTVEESVKYFVTQAILAHGFKAWDDDFGSAGTLVLNARGSSYVLSHCDDIDYNRKVRRSFETFQG